MSSEIELFHFLVGNFDFLLVDVSVKSCRHAQAALIGGASNGIEHQVETTQRLPGPVVGDRPEQAMFDVVPLRRTAWVVGNGDRKPVFVGPTLQFAFPKAGSMAVTAAAVRRDQQFLGIGMLFRSCTLPPLANRMDGKLGRVGRRANRDVSSLVRNVVNAVGDRAALGIAGKVINRDLVRFLSPEGSGVLEIPNQFGVFRIPLITG